MTHLLAADAFMRKLVLAASAVCLLALPGGAQRKPVLGQIQLPHPYYYREMYLPQLTTGPSAAAWSPDSKSLIFSMAGSLWRQSIEATFAQQITAGPGYDYQPDWARDGRWVVYASYHNDAIELHALDLQSGRSSQLTTGGNVNVEPRFSPDGKRIAFVSTAYNGRFHIFVADFNQGELANIRRITGETRSTLPRYYYSAFDTEISPAWSPDGAEIVFISNRGHIYGSGGLWRMKAEPGASARELHYEETTWRARPDWAPDGKRLVYASYLGRQWHQLWTMPAAGGFAFPLSYDTLSEYAHPANHQRGGYDNINPRWSPDGKRIAFISNRDGNTSLWVQDFPGGYQSPVLIRERRYLRPMGQLAIRIVDADGTPTPARVSVRASDGRAYAPDKLWMHADDSFDPAQPDAEAHYFHAIGQAQLALPVGEAAVEVMKGFEYALQSTKVQIAAGETAELAIRLQPLAGVAAVAGGFNRGASRWASADLHVHMNYAGSYRNTPMHLVEQGEAENLALIEDLVVNKEQRIPDIGYFRTDPDPASNPRITLTHNQEYHTSYWGHLGLLHLARNFLLPGYAGYPDTSAASLVPTNADVADLAHAQQGVVGYVHPFESVPDPSKPDPLTNELPVDVALGKVDYIEVLGFSDHKSTAEVWYKLLNCGFRLPTGAGTDAMADFASLRGPVGLNRVYAEVAQGAFNQDRFLDAVKRGRTFASNGPLLGFTLAHQQIGGDVKLSGGAHQVGFTAWLRSVVPVDHLQVVCDGEVARDLPLDRDRMRADVSATLPIKHSGWCLLRAWSDKPMHPILDLYPYATTSPIYLNVVSTPVRSPRDASYFMAWIDRLVQGVNEFGDWNSPAEKQSVLKQLSGARAVFAAELH